MRNGVCVCVCVRVCVCVWLGHPQNAIFKKSRNQTAVHLLAIYLCALTKQPDLSLRCIADYVIWPRPHARFRRWICVSSRSG